MTLKPNWQAAAALVLFLAALANPLALGSDVAHLPVAIVLVAVSIIASLINPPGIASTLVLAAAAHAAVFFLLRLLPFIGGTAGFAWFALLAACWLMAWRLVTVLSGDGSRRSDAGGIARIIVPAIFGLWILILWEGITRGAGIPSVLLPPPSAIGARILASTNILAADFVQTVLKAALIGYIWGCSAGFIVAVLADRFGFLARALLPIGNMMSALPIIGIAPIMVIWFGFDWQSKAGVVAVMTFFPMLVNTLAGLQASGHSERDLMRTYASSHWQTLARLRLPAAMPFIFNALKINSTLAMIGAIVAEFFGTPVVGMGFRISTEVGRMNLDMVWAEIAVAAVTGSVFYGVIALIERMVTFWHPSYRQG
jgi:NitT/TauT family transport system permease protein